jgi:hypothetical protein
LINEIFLNSAKNIEYPIEKIKKVLYYLANPIQDNLLSGFCGVRNTQPAREKSRSDGDK